jgi:hypothetical protein
VDKLKQAVKEASEQALAGKFREEATSSGCQNCKERELQVMLPRIGEFAWLRTKPAVKTLRLPKTGSVI